MSEQNKARIRRVIEEACSRGDLGAIARGTRRGSFQGIPATGREIRLMGTDIDRMTDGKVVECWAHVDELGLMQQLGAIGADGARPQ